MLQRSPTSEALFWCLWILAAACFAGLALWTSNEYYLPGDRLVTFGVQELHTQAWADNFFKYANHAGDDWFLGLILGVLALTLWIRRLLIEAALVIAAGFSQFVAIGLSSLVHRPDAEYFTMRAVFDGLLHPRIYPSPDGFPSGHVYGEVLVYGLVIYFAPRLIPWLSLSALVQIAAAAAIAAGFLAPMYLGAHWFSDCIAGAILGTLAGALLWRVDMFARRHRALVRVEDLIGRRAASRPTVGDARRPVRTR